jgi:hypothetical protein
MEFVDNSLAALRTGILDMTQPIAKRTHAAFILRTKATEEAADILCEGIYLSYFAFCIVVLVFTLPVLYLIA